MTVVITVRAAARATEMLGLRALRVAPVDRDPRVAPVLEIDRVEVIEPRTSPTAEPYARVRH